MKTDDPRRRETEALIAAIWGPPPPEKPKPPTDPAVREQQNRALAEALKAYLQQYLAEA